MNKTLKSNSRILLFSLILTAAVSCSANKGSKDLSLVYLNVDRLEASKSFIEAGDTFFTVAYDQLITEANLELDKEVDPVTNKSLLPPSGIKNDYLSIAPYRWPNPNTADGFPWILKDGQINPMTRGTDTDQKRLSAMFGGLAKLSMAYYFSDDEKYAQKAMSTIRIWFIDEATKVNPHIDYGQGIPGEFEGRRAGIIEWGGISNLINSIQLFDANGLLSDVDKTVLDQWIADYYNWLKTSQFGIDDDNGLQNHATNYDFQMLGLALYLGLDDEAKSRLEASKVKRIAVQIEPNGAQPRELGRTKSVHYCSMNMLKMSLNAEMGMPFGVDLLNYSTEDGRSMRQAIEYMRPFAQGDEKWTYVQLGKGGADARIESEMKPFFSIASTIFGEELIDLGAQAHLSLSYMQRLQYPPLAYLN